MIDWGEPFADVALAPRLRLDPRERDAQAPYGRVRTGVVDRLRNAAACLPDGRELLVVEGHRTTVEQARRFSRYQDRLRAEGVSDPEELRKQTSAFVSPVDVAPHCAGAAGRRDDGGWLRQLPPASGGIGRMATAIGR